MLATTSLRNSMLFRNSMKLNSVRMFATEEAVKENKKPFGVQTFKTKNLLRSEKEYDADPIKHIRERKKLADPFKPKEDVVKKKFDPNIREVPMEMPNQLMYRYLYGIVP